MRAVSVVSGVAVPLKRSNVDTDQIIPAKYLKRVTKTGFDDALFATWRTDPDFVLNQPVFSGAEVLVAGPDFGTGSSREHAVWALRDYGFQAVLSSRFGDIFQGNAAKQGLLAALCEQSDIEQIWAIIDRNPGLSMTVDLHARTATISDFKVNFVIDDYTRWRLLEGLDDIALTLNNEQRITEYEARRPSWLPRTLPPK